MKLDLKNIKKTYRNGEVVTAIKDISIGFRKNEFVSVFGPSGCGKTTLLNIIGGLDRYDSGELLIDGISTKNFRDNDWDAYRNRSIGFVFQTYNLITHQTVLQNVEIAMTLSGVSVRERRKRAKKVLADVGLSDYLKRKPNQLSGGQIQRVAIARALVNDPDIILADEPTGALDSHTSLQILDILKEISKTRLVIMVTHNSELAERYSTRIIHLLDGEIQSDDDPATETAYKDTGAAQKKRFKKTSMSLFTAISLSYRNLLTKRGRTIITSFAGSIGIIGVALVLALSYGLSLYMSSMQSETLSGFPVTITAGEQNIDIARRPGLRNDMAASSEYPDGNIIYSYDSEENTVRHDNIITQDYLEYIRGMEAKLPGAVNNISYTYGTNINLLAKGRDTVVNFNVSSRSGILSPFGGNSYWQELPESDDFILSLYDLIGEGSRLPESMNEIVLVVDEYNRINKGFFKKIGIAEDSEQYDFSDFIGKNIIKVIPNNYYYTKNDGLFTAASPADYDKLYDDDPGILLSVVGILRPKANVSGSYLNPGIAYTTALTVHVVEDAKNSDIAKAQKDSDKDVILGIPLTNEQAKEFALLKLGADTTPIGISIYPKDYESKDVIKEYLDGYNESRPESDQLIYNDMAQTITSITRTLLDTVTYVLVGFAAISLIVSTIMISIITYVSVIERTKEIGILRSVGARTKDISRVFNAETLIIGFTAGIIGVGFSYILTIPINFVILRLTEINGIAKLNLVHGISLIAGSMLLTLIAGFIPSRIAAGKDPVIALRTE